MKSLALPLLASLLCVSCGSLRVVEYEVHAINTSLQPVPSVVLIGDEVVRDEAGEPRLTPAVVKVPFELDPATGRYRTARFSVRAIVESEDGGISRGLEPGDELPYHEKSRAVKHDWPRRQLFVLRRNREF